MSFESLNPLYENIPWFLVMSAAAELCSETRHLPKGHSPPLWSTLFHEVPDATQRHLGRFRVFYATLKTILKAKLVAGLVSGSTLDTVPTSHSQQGSSQKSR